MINETIKLHNMNRITPRITITANTTKLRQKLDKALKAIKELEDYELEIEVTS